ncbi:Respiratory nitrate reductase gamma chain [hydrothermal vent metagenome]|uniref:Respiratory nitrate reductase gamma chain n=1 Tax=hydrothermal vent metagenome TaxID=652676 RepID=A0A3B0WWL5_9ZZZZ
MNDFLFGLYPYIAMTVFLLGSIFRYDRDQYTWKASSSQMLSSKGMRWGSNLFHVGIILLFFGHLFGLLMPESIYHLFMSAATKQKIAMIAGGIFGTICLIGMVILIHRRLTNPRIRATTKFSDIFILLLLFVQLVLGLLSILVSAQHPDGSSMIALANWAQHIVTFRSGAAQFIMNEALIFKLHIFLGLTLFLVFPFTRLVHVWSAPAKYLFRKGYQVVRKRG